jgi:hypothetical protein
MTKSGGLAAMRLDWVVPALSLGLALAGVILMHHQHTSHQVLGVAAGDM